MLVKLFTPVHIKVLLAIGLLSVGLFGHADAQTGKRYHSPGHYVKKLPRSHRNLVVRNRPYYYHGGQFFERRHNRRGYVVVRAPLGARVRSLPLGYVSFGLGGRRYYHVNTLITIASATMTMWWSRNPVAQTTQWIERLVWRCRRMSLFTQKMAKARR